MRAERFFFDVGTRMRHDIGEQPGLAARCEAADHHGAGDGGMRHQRMLHFAGFDAVTADLELEVVPAQAFERAVVAPAAEVAGPVEAAKRAAVDEALGGQFRSAEVAARDPLATDAQFTDDTDRHLDAARIQHVELRVLQRLADRNGRIHAIDAMATGPHSGFRGAVHVPQRPHTRQQRGGKIGRQRFATAPGTQGHVALPAGVQQHPPCGRRRLHHVDPVRRQQCAQAIGIGGILATGQPDRGAGRQR